MMLQMNHEERTCTYLYLLIRVIQNKSNPSTKTNPTPEGLVVCQDWGSYQTFPAIHKHFRNCVI